MLIELSSVRTLWWCLDPNGSSIVLDTVWQSVRECLTILLPRNGSPVKPFSPIHSLPHDSNVLWQVLALRLYSSAVNIERGFDQERITQWSDVNNVRYIKHVRILGSNLPIALANGFDGISKCLVLMDKISDAQHLFQPIKSHLFWCPSFAAQRQLRTNLLWALRHTLAVRVVLVACSFTIIHKPH